MKMDLNLTDLLKLPTKIMCALSLGTGFLLFPSEDFIEKFYMLKFRQEYGFILGLIFIISSSIAIINIISIFFKYISPKVANKIFLFGASKRLSNLNNYQKTVLYMLFQKENQTMDLPENNGAIKILEHNLMIQKVTNQIIIYNIKNPVCPYYIQQWVIDELKTNSKLLESFTEAYNDYTEMIIKEENESDNYNYGDSEYY
ncbi:hypothetical protein BB991_03115 [Listeria monocytogenes]|nr:hypothetical protein [Listeria monocytogenes]EAG1928408.1 hypothetical protein [Listeria monocytogenes]